METFYVKRVLGYLFSHYNSDSNNKEIEINTVMFDRTLVLSNAENRIVEKS